MARASYIYIVSDIPSGLIIGAFTVKHECALWCIRNLVRDNHRLVQSWSDGLFKGVREVKKEWLLPDFLEECGQ